MGSLNKDSVLFLEEHVLKTPFELLRRNFRASQRAIEKDFLALNSLVQEITKLEAAGPAGQASVTVKFEAGADRVKTLKRKLSDLLPSPSHPPLLRARLGHLSRLDDLPSTSAPGYAEWSDKRLYRYIVDYLTRTGRVETARAVAKSTQLELLVDIDLFVELHRIESSLENGNCTEALAWCGENRGTLKKNSDSLEFALRLQEYVELCRRKSSTAALAYLQKHLAPWSETHMNDIRRAMGLLACDEVASKKVLAYAAMYSKTRWGVLKTRFRTTFLNLYGLPPQPMLNAALSVGLSAFKLPFCEPPSLTSSDSMDLTPSSSDMLFDPPTATSSSSPPTSAHSHSHERNCPTCDVHLSELAKDLPQSHNMTSVLVCRISGRVLDDSEEGRAYCFPNGYVYSYGALKAMSDANDGVVKCPRSGYECDFDQLKKVYIS